mmetsp:Transcript_11321/g.24905  ORF Transcript_11321/g.24905 Transcript_11321/m.24905 type:complete len:414 (+) Transcript_11321:155-1396(+)
MSTEKTFHHRRQLNGNPGLLIGLRPGDGATTGPRALCTYPTGRGTVACSGRGRPTTGTEPISCDPRALIGVPPPERLRRQSGLTIAGVVEGGMGEAIRPGMFGINGIGTMLSSGSSDTLSLSGTPRLCFRRIRMSLPVEETLISELERSDVGRHSRAVRITCGDAHELSSPALPRGVVISTGSADSMDWDSDASDTPNVASTESSSRGGRPCTTRGSTWTGGAHPMLHGVDDPLETSCAEAPEVRAEPESDVTFRHGGPRADCGWGGRPATAEPSCPLLDPPPAMVFTHCMTPTGRGFGNTSRLPGGVCSCISGCRDEVPCLELGDAVLTLLYGLDALALGPVWAISAGPGIGVLFATAIGVTPPPPAPAATTVTELSEGDTRRFSSLGGVTRGTIPAGRAALRAPLGVLNSG